MLVVYLLQRAKQTGARSVGERLGKALQRYHDHEVAFLVPNPLDLDTNEMLIQDGDVFVPTVNVFTAVSALDPDVLVAHTVSQPLADALPMLTSHVPTLFRYGVNLTASHVRGDDVQLSSHPRFVRQFDAVLAPSEHAATKVRGLGVDPGRIHVVHPAVDFDERESHDPEESRRSVGVVARHDAIKNLPFLARALRCYEDDPEYGPAPRVLLAGETFGETPPVAEHAAALSVEHLFEPLGWVDPARSVYPRVGATVLTSLSENHPAVNAESLAAGVPVLAPDAGWAIGPTTYTPDDPAALARELHEVLSEPRVYWDLQRTEAPEGIDLPTAADHLDAALRHVVDRAKPFTVSGGVPS